MDADCDGRVPLPGSGDPDSAERAGVRRDGIRRARRVSNWTAAALIAGTGTAVVALAHQAVPVAAPASGTAAPISGARAGAPQVTHSVAVTSASGVTTTTTTRTVNGKTIVTRVRTLQAHGDD